MQEENGIIWYKIVPNKKYRVFKRVFNDTSYYSIKVKQKNIKNKNDFFSIPVQFKSGITIPNDSEIIIKKGIENLRVNKLDKYNPIHTIMILEYELIPNKELEDKIALDDYKTTMLEQEENDSYVEFGDDISIYDDELGF